MSPHKGSLDEQVISCCYPVMRGFCLAITLALIVLVAHMSLLGEWIVDDAAISYAYARSLATGHGLIAQAGAEPVEGFTNLLWVLILAVPMAVGIFDPVIIPKLFAALMLVAAFVWTARMVRADEQRPWWLVTAALVTTALTPGFAIWCASGMENALYVTTVVLYGASCLRVAEDPRRSLLAGLSIFVVFCARPDGVLYFWVAPFLVGLERAPWKRVGTYVAAFGLPWVLLTIGRAVYFGDLLPNTFYAKDAMGVKVLVLLFDALPLPAATLVFASTGMVGAILVAWLAHRAGGILASKVSAERVRHNVPVLLAVTAWLVYRVLREDWMGEYRFLTPYFLLAPAALLGLVHDVAEWRRRGRAATVVTAVALVISAGLSLKERTPAFAERPTLSMQAVQASTRQFAARLETLEREVLVATPDIGGALWENGFQVLDLAGLIDPRLGRPDLRHDQPAVCRYLVNECRPDAVWLHSAWYARTVLNDSLFHAHYVADYSEGPPPAANFYVRRDLVEELVRGR